MSNFLFHNKFHQANHHTIATPGLPDSATDPIASQSEPFQGIFYNYLNALVNLSAIDVSYLETFLTDSITTFDGLSVNTIQSIYAAITANVFTNSRQWFEMYTNINGLSVIYGLYPTVSTTVNTYSGYWNLGYNFYSSLNALSTNYFSTYTMVNTYSANWPFIDTTLRLNLMQQNTRSKNFSGVNITSISVNTSGVSAYWNLSAAQCAFFRLTGTTVFKNIVNSNNKKKGGEYVLVLQQDGFGNRAVSFESDYVFSPSSLGQILSSYSTIIIGVSTGATIGTTKWFGTGNNDAGALGLGDNSDRNVLTPLTGNWSQMVCGGDWGDDFTMALSAGTTKWFGTGFNFFGSLGLGDNSSRNVFTPLTGNWSQMACGGDFTMALSAGTTKWFGTGRNIYGALGLGDNSDRNVFTPLTGNWSQMSCGRYHTMALSAGTTKWFAVGNGGSGQLGLGPGYGNPNLFTALTGDWSYMVCGKFSTMALSAGTTKWFGTGSNYWGNLALGDAIPGPAYSVFTPLTGNWSQMVCGGDFTMALSAGTTKWFSTGYNSYGQLGLGDNSDRNVFTPLTGNWSQMACGLYHTMALSAGTAKWFGTGWNAEGELGLGDNSDRNVFTPLTGNWYQMSCGRAHTMAMSATTLQTTLTALTANVTTYVVSPTALSVTVVRFTCDGNKLYGKPTFYYYERDTIWTYFAGPGLIFTPSPAEFYINDYFIPINGLTVAGVVVPAQGYSDGGGITVVEGLPS
jgi:alpha-tubulin suppressor-like RCC1 family protein